MAISVDEITLVVEIIKEEEVRRETEVRKEDPAVASKGIDSPPVITISDVVRAVSDRILAPFNSRDVREPFLLKLLLGWVP